MQLPLQIVQVGSQKVNRAEQTRDISSGGVCFTSREHVEVGGRIEYWITLSGSKISGSNPPVRIRCLGKVLRSQRQIEGEAPVFEIAVTMERYHFMSTKDTGTFAAAS